MFLWGARLSRFELYYKVIKNYILGRVADAQDIGESYDMVSSTYDSAFICSMRRYNVAMLSQLEVPQEATILDLACGTGFNSEWLLNQYPSITIDGVDISDKMLQKTTEKLDGKVQLFHMTMLDYLRQCPDNSYDIVVCGWALKYQSPITVLRECKRVLKPKGQIGVILNTKNTLPEVRKVYTQLLISNSGQVGNLMLELPNPKDQKDLESWFVQAGLVPFKATEGQLIYRFETAGKAVDWVTSTGALAGFDVMLNLRDESIKKQMTTLFEQHGIFGITHKFVWGGAAK